MKRLTYQKLALGGLRAHKKQYIPLTLGIVLAIYFACTVLLAGQSLIYTDDETYRDRYGAQDAAILNADASDEQALLDSGVVSRLERIQTLAVATVDDNAVCAVGKGDESALELLRKRCTEGRMPESADEIAVEATILRRLDRDAQIGDEIALTLYTPDGQNGFLPHASLKVFTLTGILADQIIFFEDGGVSEDYRYDLTYCLMPAAIVGEDAVIADGGMPVTHLAFQHPSKLSDRAFLTALKDLSLGFNYMNRTCRDLEMYGFLQVADQSGTMYAVVIVGGALILCACLGVANAFTANLSERRGQIGLLRAVGATRRQIRRVFGREALTIALITAPPALGLACLTVWLGDAALGLYRFHTAPAFLLAALLIALLVVFAAAQIPLFSAARISPMQAIRDTSLLRARKRLRVRPQKSFRVPALLASRHMRLYRTHRLGATLLVALSLPLLAVAGYFCWVQLAFPLYGSSAYDYRLSANGFFVSSVLVDENAAASALSEADLREITELPLVRQVDGLKSANVNWLLNDMPDYLTLAPAVSNWMSFFYQSDDPSYAYDRRQYEQLRQQQKIDQNMFAVEMYAASAEQVKLLEPYVLEGAIDIDALNAGREVLVIAPPTVYIRDDGNGGGYKSFEPHGDYDYAFQNDVFFAGDTLDLCRLSTPGTLSRDADGETTDFLTGVSRSDAAVRIGAILPANWPGFKGILAEGFTGPGYVITTLAGMEALGMSPQGYEVLAVQLSQSPDEAQEALLTAELQSIASQTPFVQLYSQLERQRAERQSNALFIACAASIILFCFALSASIISNSLTNRIRADRQTIGTLRAVGAPLDAILASYRRQLNVMLLSGFTAGLALCAAACGVLHAVQVWFMDPLPSALLVLGLSAAFLLLLGLSCGLTLRARLREVARRSIVENVREL
ncbi:MAG: FtsX-like permease family protein [Clostridia bacterium]|nr:FtsX-like permease family protein [Clostridia bacterium]